MADNFNFTEGSGAVGAADDISSVYYPYVKLVDGTAESTTKIVVDVGAKANALRVCPANDITDTTYIGDIKFGESLPAGTNAIGKLAANTGVDIGDVDVTSIIPGVAATNLGKARDSALGATDTGVMALAVRDDTLTTLTPADGDYVPLRVSSTGQLHVTGAGGGTEYTEDVVTANPQVGSAIMVERDDALTTVTPVEADWIGLRGTAEGALWVQDFNSDAALALLGTMDTDTGVIAGDTTSIDGKITACNTGAVVLATGSAAIGKLAANTGVDIGDVDVTSVVPGTAATNLGKAEDAAHSSGDVGVAAMTVRANTATSLSGSDNDYQPLITDTNGRLHVLDANSTTIVSDTTAIKAAVEIMDDWDAVHDSAASSDGPQVMAAYDSTKPAVVEDGDAVRMLADQYGRLLAGVEPQAFEAVYDSADASGEGETVHASAASTIIVVQSYVISVDAEIWVKLQEEDSTALTGKFWLKAGGGVAITLPDKAPIVLGVDSDLEVITEGAGNVSVSVTGYTIPG